MQLHTFREFDDRGRRDHRSNEGDERCRFDEARTLLQSGKIVFSTARRNTPQLERTLATEVERRLRSDRKKLGTRATGRNWNTVLKLEALLGNEIVATFPQ